MKRDIFTSMKDTILDTSAVIFDVKRYAIHDGPGIRTAVFFKGCPLRCRWCHNPEGIETFPELLLNATMCATCYTCLKLCPNNAYGHDESGAVTPFRELCKRCGVCVEACPYDALQLAGRQVSLKTLLGELERDRIFYDQSTGGVTLTGGEPLLQHEFAIALLKELRYRSTHSALDTSGYAPEGVFRRAAAEADLILFDLKLLNEDRHREVTGVSNRQIIDNLKWSANSGHDLVIRIPLVPGINDSNAEIHDIAQFLAHLGGIRYVHILPYHRGGLQKARRLGKSAISDEFEVPSEEKLNNALKILRDHGFDTKLGG